MTQNTQTKGWDDFLNLVEKSNLPEFQAPLKNNIVFNWLFGVGALGMMMPFFMIAFGAPFFLAMTAFGLSLPFFLTGFVMMDSDYALKKRVESAWEREKTLKMIGEGLGLLSSSQKEHYKKLHTLFKEQKGNACFWKKLKYLHKQHLSSLTDDTITNNTHCMSLGTEEGEYKKEVLILEKEKEILTQRTP